MTIHFLVQQVSTAIEAKKSASPSPPLSSLFSFKSHFRCAFDPDLPPPPPNGRSRRREDIGRASNANDSKMLLLRLLLLLPPFWGNEITRVSPRLEQAWIGPPQGYPSWARRQSGCCRCCRCCCCCRWRPRSLDSEDKWEEEEEAALTSSWSRWW